ncbi:TonB-dependent siderophore receptor [Psychrobacter sp. Arc29]|uniref:TonB-dependent siderophore receptor n=1 Tax=Psychrobacter sp. Arc29 TaxID=3046690 RepID=UPI00352D2CE1
MFIITKGTKRHKPSSLSWFIKQTMHLSAIASLAVSSSIIHAETTDRSATGDSIAINDADKKAEPSTTLETIVVTADIDAQITENTDRYTIPTASSATGLALSAKETPQATSVVTNQQIKDQNSTNLTEVLKRAPGIQVGSIDGARSGFSARGFGITGFQIDGLNTDFVQQAAMGEYSANTAMFDHVEIVRGATGLMSGSGDPSANVNLIRKRADSTVPATELSANVDRYGNYGVSIDRSQPLTKDGAVRGRVVASYQDGDTFIDRQELGQNLIYATVDADVSDNTTVSVGASRQHNKSKSTMWGGLPSYLSDGSKAEWDTSKNGSADWSNWDSDNVYYFADIDHDFNEDWNLTTNASYNESDSSPKLLYIYANGSQVIDPNVGLVYNLNPFHADTERKQINVKTELTGNFDALGRTHQVIVGGSYNKSDLDTFTYTAPPDGLLPISDFDNWDGSYAEPAWGAKTQSSDVTTKEKAIFAATQLKLTDPLSVILGSRVSEYERSGFQYGTKMNTESEHIWAPYAGITYDINNNHSIYSSYSTIFKPQSERDINGTYLDPVEGKNYEIGLKSESDNGALQSQVSIFRIEQNDLAQDSGQIIPGAGLERAYFGVDAVSQGVEVEVTGQLSDKLKAAIGYTHFNAEGRDGKPVNTGYADTTLNLFATYDMNDIVPNLTVGGGIDWSNGYYGVVTNPVTGQSEKYGQDNVTLASIMAKYAINDNLEAQLNVNNLFNQKYLAGENFFGLTYGEPLNVVGRVTYRF